ncbi:MAG TPA: DUF4429 domain-containing protein [Chloroflexota bacterium]|nr:DUF4429 domain-containing protein [Chloroflexota bacterium]
MAMYDGYNGQVELTDDELVITRSGAIAKMAVGKVAPRRIPLQALTGVRLKKATRLTSGHIQFLMQYEDAAALPVGKAGMDPNTVLFAWARRDTFAELARLIEARIAHNTAEGLDASAVDVAPADSDRIQYKAWRESEKAKMAEDTARTVAEMALIHEEYVKAKAGLKTELAEFKAIFTEFKADAVKEWTELRESWKELKHGPQRVPADPHLAKSRGQHIASYAGVTLYERVIVTPDGESDVAGARAYVESAGTLIQRERATLTRFIALGPLAGIAFKKKSEIDSRELYLIVDAATVASAVTCRADAGVAARKFAAAITSAGKIAAVQELAETAEAEIAAAPGTASENLADVIRSLAQLRDDGILSEQEFQVQKTKLLRM